MRKPAPSRPEVELGPREQALMRASVTQLWPIDQAALNACISRCRLRLLARGEFLLRAGEPATHAGVLLTGLLREYFQLEDGSERTKAFVLEGDPTGSLADLMADGCSRASIVAEEPARLVTVPFTEMRALALQYPAWKEYGARLLERLFLRKAEREYELLGLSAEARYQLFLRKFPGLSARVKARHIASYVGITPVHLSRLRRRARSRPHPENPSPEAGLPALRRKR